jgi:AAA15 family ATPase/GTPase
MKLENITIKNYRSISELSFSINELNDNSTTFGLIGVNEAGKSSILKALALKDNFTTRGIKQNDFHSNKLPVEVDYQYELLEAEKEELLKKATEVIPEFDANSELFKTVHLNYRYDFSALNQDISLSFPNLTKSKGVKIEKATIEAVIVKLLPTILEISHKTIFWTAKEQYLISGAINLANFASNPDSVSIPLRNCFLLSGIDNIPEAIALISESTEREQLRELLGEKVTTHIRGVWPKHPIKITFDISDGNIHFHVNDENAKVKAKTAEQRSDGFRQFISFLLTLSAESRNAELQNTIILLDEPETHLHPKAQEDLLKELILLTKDTSKNIVFFATHSNYMVDKSTLERYYKIEKPEHITKLSKFDNKTSTYASINFDAFNILSTDYHNELYGKAQAKSDIDNGTEFDKYLQTKIPNCVIKQDYEHTNGSKFNCSLPTYIRHLIHHPENDKNIPYTHEELEHSTNALIALLPKISPKLSKK